MDASNGICANIGADVIVDVVENKVVQGLGQVGTNALAGTANSIDDLN
jgi:hypothetical protein